MSSLFAIIQEETFNQWQIKNQDKILNSIFLQLVKTKRVFSNDNNFSVLFLYKKLNIASGTSHIVKLKPFS